MPSFRASSRPRDGTCISCIAGGFFTAVPPGKHLLGWIKAKKNAVPPHSPTLLPHSLCFRETRPREPAGSEAGREAQPLPGSWGLPSLYRLSVPTAWDMAPPFGTVAIRLTRSLPFPALFVAKSYLCLPLSQSVCLTLRHCWWALAQGLFLGDNWGKASVQTPSGRDVQTQRVAQLELSLEAERTGTRSKAGKLLFVCTAQNWDQTPMVPHFYAIGHGRGQVRNT